MEKQQEYVVVSGYSCLDKLSPRTRKVHLRKFISKKLMHDIVSACADLREVSLPRHISEKISKDVLELLKQRKIEITVSENMPGRPNMLDNMLKWKRLNNSIRLGKKYN